MRLRREASYKLAALVLLVGGLLAVWRGDYRYALSVLVIILALALFSEEY